MHQLFAFVSQIVSRDMYLNVGISLLTGARAERGADGRRPVPHLPEARNASYRTSGAFS